MAQDTLLALKFAALNVVPQGVGGTLNSSTVSASDILVLFQEISVRQEVVTVL